MSVNEQSGVIRAFDTTPVVQGDTLPAGSLPALNENFGAPYAARMGPFVSPLGLPCQQPPWGYVAGVDPATGKVARQHRNARCATWPRCRCRSAWACQCSSSRS